MNEIFQNTAPSRRTYILLSLFFFIGVSAFSQNITTLRGVVKDSITQELLPYVTIQFEGTTIGVYSGEDGSFKLSNKDNKTKVIVSFLGYRTKRISLTAGQTVEKEILLSLQDRQLDEVIIRPTKEKYSKKNNPAVELIKKVIKNKNKNNVSDRDYFQCEEYERTLFAFNDFKPNRSQFKKFKFLPNYVVTSSINHKPILPFSVWESISDYYYQKQPKTERRVIKAYDQSGLDKAMEIEGMETLMSEVFKDVSIRDNNITMLFHNFVSPLSEQSAVSFYRWYIVDTLNIEDKSYINLAYIPFNTRDIGFSGNLYISNDSTYAVKRAILKAPRKMNINYVDELVIQQDFKEIEPNKWVPEKQQMAVDLSLIGAVKFYIEKNRSFDNYTFDPPLPTDTILTQDAPLLYAEGAGEKTKDFWNDNRPEGQQMDYRLDEMMDDIMNIGFFKAIVKTGKFLSGGGYIHTSKDADKSKVDIGTALTAYSYNSIEGNRLRLTTATTKNLHPHLYFYGYGAYGTKDRELKYYGEVTWAFDRIKIHKDEFPKNNIMFAYKYDVNSLGQRFTQQERDNIFMSLKSSKNEKLTYNRQSQISWQREFHGGFSYKISAQTFDERAAGRLQFLRLDAMNNKVTVGSIRSSEMTLALRYAPKEKFFQQRRQRYEVPSPNFEFNLAHTSSLKGVIGGQFDYNKVSFSVARKLWIAPYGKLSIVIEAERIWGEAPFPLLISPSANNSYTIQQGNFYLIQPLEFIHDRQIAWNIEYKMEGWLFNRIPLINRLKLREVMGFRGVAGDLKDRNDPVLNHELILFPDNAYKANKEPYMEYNVGIENIFSLIRIDYVRRLNYLKHPGVDKDGIRLSLQLIF